jgi:glutathione S-transferase
MSTERSERDPEVLKEHARELHAELTRWEAALAEGYVAGGTMTLADFAVHAYVETLFHLGMSLDRWPKVAQHRRHMAALEAFTTTRPTDWREPAVDDPWAERPRAAPST